MPGYGGSVGLRIQGYGDSDSDSEREVHGSTAWFHRMGLTPPPGHAVGDLRDPVPSYQAAADQVGMNQSCQAAAPAVALGDARVVQDLRWGAAALQHDRAAAGVRTVAEFLVRSATITHLLRQW